MVRENACSCQADALEYTMQKLSRSHISKKKIMQSNELTLAVCLAPHATNKWQSSSKLMVNEWFMNKLTQIRST